MSIKKTRDIFTKNLAACVLQAHSLNESLAEISNIIPFVSYDIAQINSEHKKTVDAFLLRFGRLQDMLGSKIFRGILLMGGEEVGSVIDILNKMEKFGIIGSADEWLSIRESRNNVVHEYITDPEDIAESLNQIVNYAYKLVAVIECAKVHSQKYFKINL
jgi:hypothetical protein